MNHYTSSSSTLVSTPSSQSHHSRFAVGQQVTPPTASLTSHDYPNILQKRMSVVNLEAAVGVSNSFANPKVSRISLAYRFREATGSRLRLSRLAGEAQGAWGHFLR